MGRALEPGKKVSIVLDWDKNKPEETRPTFICKSFSMREQIAFEEKWSTIREQEARTPHELSEFLLDALMMFLEGWKNQTDPATGDDIPFDRDNVFDVLADEEAYELIGKIRFFSQPTPDEKKSSE